MTGLGGLEPELGGQDSAVSLLIHFHDQGTSSTPLQLSLLPGRQHLTCLDVLVIGKSRVREVPQERPHLVPPHSRFTLCKLSRHRTGAGT